MNPNQKVKLDFGASMSYQYSKSPALNNINPFTYAYFANPYESHIIQMVATEQMKPIIH